MDLCLRELELWRRRVLKRRRRRPAIGSLASIFVAKVYWRFNHPEKKELGRSTAHQSAMVSECLLPCVGAILRLMRTSHVSTRRPAFENGGQLSGLPTPSRAERGMKSRTTC